MTGSNTGDDLLRAKYLDWCSARIAERFLALSPDEIYQLAERATHGAADSVTPLAPLSPSDTTTPDWQSAIDQAVTEVATVASRDPLSFRTLVARVTVVLADDMELPSFEEWSAAYSEAPEEFDRDMLGFWKERP